MNNFEAKNIYHQDTNKYDAGYDNLSNVRVDDEDRVTPKQHQDETKVLGEEECRRDSLLCEEDDKNRVSPSPQQNVTYMKVPGDEECVRDSVLRVNDEYVCQILTNMFEI